MPACQLLEQTGHRHAVVRDVQAAVVAQVDGRVAEIRGQARTVGVAGVRAAPVPDELVPHQAVQEHRQPLRRIRKGGAQRGPVQLDGLTPDAQRGGLVKLASRALEPVADEAVDRSQCDAPAARGRDRDLRPTPQLSIATPAARPSCAVPQETAS